MSAFHAPGRTATTAATECFACGAPRGQHAGTGLACPTPAAHAMCSAGDCWLGEPETCPRGGDAP